ncbi:activating signal cointegrator 1 [Copidosoma floridanum]|uniref:activating signal cointegrator 1 n=1 Tax=Copidosoma floridanum TaxID=29053 RepID=UPI0006C98B68|nr:activating signal cointegrator 1 [Copidosoma floridanum]
MEKRKKSGNQRGKKNTKNKSNLSDKITRTVCDCEATKHSLVNNCLNCGRIVCLSEGPGPCFFCGAEVSYEKNALLPPKFTKESDNKQKQFSKDKKTPDLPSESLKLRDRLLEFDKNCASRTSVIDDESDYYQANSTWLSKSEREKFEKLSLEAHDKKHESRLMKKFAVDFTGRVEVEQDDPLDLFCNMNAIQDDRHYDNPNSRNAFDIIERPIYVGDDNLPSTGPDMHEDSISNRVQDKGILEITDKGVCLSMHQPYASLLVRGIKKTECRTWYSSHRGRLWIASTAKEPRAEEIKAIEDMYRHISSKETEFPQSYPTGCLIGCVTVTDVLSQEEYQKLNPYSPVESPYIFMCENFFELPLKYPLQGKHKIYKLEPVIHRAALNCLEKTCKQMSKKN